MMRISYRKSRSHFITFRTAYSEIADLFLDLTIFNICICMYVCMYSKIHTLVKYFNNDQHYVLKSHFNTITSNT